MRVAILDRLVWRPAHTDFLVGHDDKATQPLVDFLRLKYLLQTFHLPQPTGRVQPNQHDAVMCTRGEATVVREIQVLCDEGAAFSLGLCPKLGIVATGEIFLLGSVNIVSKLAETSCDLQREVLIELGFH